jgi:ABC-type transporter MlaC component
VRKRRFWLALLIVGPALAQAPPGPLETVRKSNQAVQSVLGLHDAITDPARVELRGIIDAATDFGTISRRVVESFCKKLTAAECEEFDRTFQELLRASSLRKLGRYRADRFEYLGEEIDGGTAVVRTLAFYEDESIRLDYVMERPSGRWVVVNYLVDEVDTVRNYRKQFLRLFARNDFAGVVGRLKAKIAEIEAER